MKLICPHCGGLIGYVSGHDIAQPDLETDLIEAHDCPPE